MGPLALALHRPPPGAPVYETNPSIPLREETSLYFGMKITMGAPLIHPHH
jgi:hypothetical protein